MDEDYNNTDDDTAYTELETDKEYNWMDQEEINDLVADTKVKLTNISETNQPPVVEIVEDNNEPAPPAEKPAPEPAQKRDESPPPILRRSNRTTKNEPISYPSTGGLTATITSNQAR